MENLTIGDSESGKIKFSVSTDLNGASSLKIENADQNATEPISLDNAEINNLKNQQEILNSIIIQKIVLKKYIQNQKLLVSKKSMIK